ncbi:hypothetical protein NQD34_000144 [Periophthalmus magnuspinnatus]|nr:hypothetical protein NQD34_000144 [Periophthalmus magnuspinnatus]
MWRIAVVLLSLLSLGQCAPLDNCETLLKPIPISHGDMLGRWLYIGGTSDLPGSYLNTSSWVDIRPTSQSNILELIRAHRINGNCFTLKYNVTFENSTLLIESSFYLKEVYLPTESSDCLVIYETLSSENEAIKSLFLFSKNRTVSPAAVEMVKKQAECLQMPSLLMVDPNSGKSSSSTKGKNVFVHPFSSSYPGPGHGGSSLCRDSQTSHTPDMSSSSSGGNPRRSQARET